MRAGREAERLFTGFCSHFDLPGPLEVRIFENLLIFEVDFGWEKRLKRRFFLF
jgi:hypothetical protein